MIYFNDRNSFTFLFYILFQSKLGDNIFPVFTLNFYHPQCPTILLATGINYTAQACMNLIILRTLNDVNTMVYSSSLKADNCATFEVLTAEIMKIQDISDTYYTMSQNSWRLIDIHAL
jgi:hypothetical protein